MSKLLVLLVLCMTTFLSSLFSPARGDDGLPLYSFEGWSGSNQMPLVNNPVPRDGVIVAPITRVKITGICIQDPPVDCSLPGFAHLPHDTQLKTTNSAIAEVSTENSNVVIRLNSPGSTILQLRLHKEILASYVFVVTPAPPGTLCEGLNVGTGPTSLVVGCSGKCVEIDEVLPRLDNKHCDDGSEHDGGSEPIDLSCASFLPEFFIGASSNRTDPDVLARLNSLTNKSDPDGGDCTPEQSCKAQFGTAPGYELCDAITSASFRGCIFNATTGKDTPTGFGTCAEMCQRFGSLCLGALDNNPPGCTPNPESRDTCETPRQTEICLCERG